MYKIVLLLSAFVLSSSSIGQKIKVGPEIGMNLINVENQEIGDNFQPAWHGGGIFEYQFATI